MKEFFRILINRIRINAVEMGISVFTESIQEYRRAKKDGAFDLHAEDLHKTERDQGETQNENLKNINHG